MFLMGENKGLLISETPRRKNPNSWPAFPPPSQIIGLHLGFVLSRHQEKTDCHPYTKLYCLPQARSDRADCYTALSPHFCLPPLQSTQVFPDICMSPSSAFLIPDFSTPPPLLQAISLGGIGTSGCLSLWYKMFSPISDVRSFKRAS